MPRERTTPSANAEGVVLAGGSSSPVRLQRRDDSRLGEGRAVGGQHAFTARRIASNFACFRGSFETHR